MSESYYNSSLTGDEIESALVFADGASKINGIMNVKDSTASALTLAQTITEDTTAVPSSNAVKVYVDDIADTKQDTIEDLETIRSGAAAGATAVQTETDPTVPEWAKADTKPAYTATEITSTDGNVQTDLDSLNEDITHIKDMTSAEEQSGAYAKYHLGFYLDENGELCELED